MKALHKTKPYRKYTFYSFNSAPANIYFQLFINVYLFYLYRI